MASTLVFSDIEYTDEHDTTGGVRLSNDRKWIPLTFMLLAVMAVICSALVVYSVWIS